MKKPILFLAIIFSLGLLSCQSNDTKDESKPYQSTDTNTVDKLNIPNPDSIKSTSSSNDDIH